MKKYEREIRDLLDKLDTFVPESPAPDKERNRDREPEREPRKRSVGVMPAQPIPIRPRRSRMSGFSQWLTEHKVNSSLRLMLTGLGLVILALIIHENVRLQSLTWMVQLLGAIGGLVFLSPVLIRFFRGTSLDSDANQYWRGQSVESEHFSWSSLKNWFGSRRGSKGPGKDPFKDRNNRW